MAKLSDRPLCCCMALRAVVAEQPLMSIFRLVTRRAVEQRFFGLQMGVRRLLRHRVGFFEPAFDDTGIQRLAFEFP